VGDFVEKKIFNGVTFMQVCILTDNVISHAAAAAAVTPARFRFALI